MSAITATVGRILIGLLFVISGFNKVMYPAGFVTDLQAVNLPAAWAQGIGIFEMVAGLLLGLGLMTRLVSVVLAIWTLLTIFFFYNQFSDYDTGTTALRLLAVTGGLLLTFAYGNVRGSLDHYRSRAREQQAELRAARAEADAEATRRVAAETPADNRPVRP
ncbi:DoxX family protein [Erythrobacteraceae bacterium CFH 75059]|uniref:DoxX family protein n=1 Tax=Qipengyuania thermophila TaxID=2509361 RepID=UPI001021CA7F|nr:DoxX family protein [Qipengyuania thermophila]TCD06419.1 DoxX family protein [Erythrobacteraceae bacterium CFH 75059]